MALLCVLASAAAGKGQPSAARSVHLHYEAPEAELFYNEVTVEESQQGTYFCACGFSMGYFGIQELGRGRGKVVIFSVWEPGAQNDPSSVAEDKRVQLLSKGDGVRAGRFGGEGTGGQSFLDYQWKVGETCRFLVKASRQGERTAYAAYFYLNNQRRWQHIATFSTLAGGALLKGYYSFIEDFRRDGVSATEPRRARFGNGWVRTADGQWHALTRARFTGDSTPTLNVDAGISDGGFYLATGGDVRNTVPLGSVIARQPIAVGLPLE